MRVHDIESRVIEIEQDPHVPTDRRAACATMKYVLIPLLRKWKAEAGFLAGFGISKVIGLLEGYTRSAWCTGQVVETPEAPEVPPPFTP